jgi:hypothetical protein
MKPKEKAQILYNDFCLALRFEETGDGYFTNIKQAKECALICIDNIISANPHSNPLNSDVHSTMNYWFEVKQQIQKL